MNRAEQQKAHRLLVESALCEIKEDIRQIKTDQSIMKADVAHHIKRSDKHETWLMGIIVALAVGAGAGLPYILPIVMKLL